ncbi:MAG: preprotein translocase subunit YajC [Thermoleophilia bacterium]|nr:preprotein translocase subunit YajC [Thermoleophilia bacterium]
MLPLLVLLGTIAGAWYLLIVRPQKDQQTRHGRLVERLQVGDHVLTVGGIYGRVTALEGSSVVLELGPGLTTRIATDGVARIVHAGEGALPTTAATSALPGPVQQDPPRQALDTDMHQHHPHPDQQHAQAPQPVPAQQQHFAAPAFQAPQQPWTTAQQPQVAPQPMPHAQPQYAQPQYAQQPMPVQQAPVATLRAQVVEPVMTHEPQPWGDVAPVNARPVAQWQPPQPPPMAMHIPFAQQQAPAAAMPQPVAPQQLQPPAQQFQQPMPMPVQHTPAAPVMQPVVVPSLAPAHAVPMQQPMPVEHAPQAQHPHGADASAQQLEARRHSKAPKGMGSSLRLDDPTLSDAMSRARDERAGLANEYRKLTAPMVATEDQPVHAQPVALPAETMVIGHDPNGQPLFAAPGAPPAHPVAQYPAPARVPGSAAMPRPNVNAPIGAVDPALTAAAFQRRTPYAPDPALTEAAAPAPAPAPAYVHAHG